MEAQGNTHWWYLARKKLLRYALDAYETRAQPKRILDLASACGGNIPVCRPYGMVAGIDISDEAITICKRNGLQPILKGDAHQLPFIGGVFDVVVAFDVFEHLKQDVDAMAEAHRVLKPGGLLLVNVPAFMTLYSYHDEAFDHLRRYHSKDLAGKLKSTGFEVSFDTYWSFFIFPAVFLVRKLMGKNPKDLTSDFGRGIPQFLDRILALLSRVETATIKRKFKYPFGVSLFCVAQKISATSTGTS